MTISYILVHGVPTIIPVDDIPVYCQQHNMSFRLFKRRAKKIKRMIEAKRLFLARQVQVEPDDTVWDEMLAQGDAR